MSTSTPAPVASISSGHTEIDASTAGAAAVACTPSVTSGGRTAAALADTPAVASKFNDILSAVVCSAASSLVDGGAPFEREGNVETFATNSLAAASARVSELSCGVGGAPFERKGDVETFATDSLAAASAPVSVLSCGLSCGVDVTDSSRFGDSACRTFKPSGPRNQQRRLAVRSTR